MLELNDLEHILYTLLWFLLILKGCGVGDERCNNTNKVPPCRAFRRWSCAGYHLTEEYSRQRLMPVLLLEHLEFDPIPQNLLLSGA